jgi:choline dehydrogenase
VDQYDYIVVGAGSAGCVLANRLSAKPGVKVLLLEAGGQEKGLYHKAPIAFSKLFKGQSDWAFSTEPQSQLHGRKLFWPRGKVLGGSSSINAMIYIRGNALDYDDWKMPGWSYPEVLPYFKKLESHPLGETSYHGSSGPLSIENRRYTNPLSQAFVEAGVQAGLPHNPDFNGASQDGVGLLQVTHKNGARHSTASAYLKPILHRTNLVVQTQARVQRVLIENGQALGVVYHQQGLKKAYGKVVLAGGAVQSPQLLMLSGIGPADHLKSQGISVLADLPVGKNLWDHLALPVIFACKQPVSLDKAENLGNLLQYALFQQGPFASNVAEAGGFAKMFPGPTPDIQYHFGPAYFDNHGFDRGKGYFFTIGPTLIAPQSRGFIELKSADPQAAPFIQPNYLSDPHDLEVMLRAVEHARHIASQKAFDAYRGPEVSPDKQKVEDYIRSKIQTLYHPAGTCSMGQVVDERLNVYGIEHLYVVDASVMPNVVRGNTNAPTIMLAEKAADLLEAV